LQQYKKKNLTNIFAQYGVTQEDAHTVFEEEKNLLVFYFLFLSCLLFKEHIMHIA